MTTDGDTEFGGWRACDACGEAIASPDEAALTVPPELIEERRAGIAERARALAAGEEAARASTGLIPWDWGHRACFPPRDEAYFVAGARIATMPGILAETLALMDREWFMETAWEDAVRRFYRIPFE